MTCDEVRELLPEHLLGSLPDTDDARIRRHLRGCAECRAERARLEDGVAALSYAIDQEPPEALREQVLGVLGEEWSEEERPEAAVAGPARSWRWVALAAAALLLVVSLGWGGSQWRRADRLAAEAGSYRTLLDTLGGKEFRLGTLHGTAAVPMTGTVVLYDALPGEQGWYSWGIVFASAPGYEGEARALLVAEDGRSLELPPLRFVEGEASSWIVTHDELTPYDELVVTDGAGSVLASARIAPA